MKKLRLKKWVKVSLVCVGILAFVVVSNLYTSKAIDQCVKSGHSQSYCENGLR